MIIRKFLIIYYRFFPYFPSIFLNLPLIFLFVNSVRVLPRCFWPEFLLTFRCFSPTLVTVTTPFLLIFILLNNVFLVLSFGILKSSLSTKSTFLQRSRKLYSPFFLVPIPLWQTAPLTLQTCQSFPGRLAETWPADPSSSD